MVDLGREGEKKGRGEGREGGAKMTSFPGSKNSRPQPRYNDSNNLNNAVDNRFIRLNKNNSK